MKGGQEISSIFKLSKKKRTGIEEQVRENTTFIKFCKSTVAQCKHNRIDHANIIHLMINEHYLFFYKQ